MTAIPLYLLLICLQTCFASKSNKRGLIYIPNKKYPGDDSIWTSQGSDISWYYTYAAYPIDTYSKANWEFVPMLWGTPDSPGQFLNTVKNFKNQGVNITNALGFNEPDGPFSTGGTSIQASTAATYWINEIEPLKDLGIRLGAPATQGNEAGINWLKSFMSSCNGKCTIDFIPVHYYGDFTSFSSYVGQVYATFGLKPIWVTEFALPNAALGASQSFFNQSMGFLDNLTWVERYSYFGSFRSSSSNIGPNAAMLTQNGKLTDIGSEYLGGAATGNIPAGGSVQHGVKRIYLFLVLFACMLNL